jgi:hypothetical protein
MKRVIVGLKRAAMIGAFAMLAAGGCSSQTQPPPAVDAGSPLAQANFDLQKCEQLEPNLYKCPAVDKPLCTPEYNRDDLICVRIGPKGSVFVQRPGYNS